MTPMTAAQAWKVWGQRLDRGYLAAEDYGLRQQALDLEFYEAAVERQRCLYADMAELAKTSPELADRFVEAAVAHLRAWRPEVALAPSQEDKCA